MIIGFSGKKYSGKTTSAIVLRDYLTAQGKQATIVSFGNPIKELIEGEGTDIQSTETNPELKEQIRKLYQDLGTDAVRTSNVRTWVDIGILTIRAYYMWRGVKDTYVLIDDMRFPNEITALWDAFDPETVITMRLLRNIASAGDKRAQHRSETALDDFDGFDYIIDNIDLSLEEKNELVLSTFRGFQQRQAA